MNKPIQAFEKRHRQCNECDRRDFINQCMAKTTTNANKRRIGRYLVTVSDPFFKEFNFILKTPFIIDSAEVTKTVNDCVRVIAGKSDVYTSELSPQEYLWFETSVPSVVGSNTHTEDVKEKIFRLLHLNITKRVNKISR